LLACSGLSGCDDAGPEKLRKEASVGIRAEAAALRPPPPWLPPNYTEMPWSEAAALIQRQAIDRAVATTTRRVYLVMRNGDKHYTTAPRSNEVIAMMAKVPREKIEFMWRDNQYEEISWAEAVSLLHRKRVNSVSLSHFNMMSVNVKELGPTLAITPSEEEVRKILAEVDPSGNLLSAIE